MYNCEICGNTADIHHIVHRSEGGFDIDINYKYLCALHHRGKNGPHQNQFIDLQYKVDMQNKLYNILKKEYYSPKEISQILEIHSNSLKRRKWQPTPVFLPGESQGWWRLVGCRLWGRTKSDTTEAN